MIIHSRTDHLMHIIGLKWETLIFFGGGGLAKHRANKEDTNSNALESNGLDTFL